MAKPSLFKKTQKQDPTVNSEPLPPGVVVTSPASSPPAGSGALVPFASLSGNTSLMAAMDGQDSPTVSQDPPGNYVVFAHPMSKRFPAMSAAIPGLGVFTPVLLAGSERPQRLLPFRAHLIDLHEYYAHVDREGTMLEVSLTKPADFKSPLKHTVDAVLLVYTPDGIRASRCRFAGAMTRAAAYMAETLKIMKSPEWGTLSAEHKQTLALPKPFLRGVFEITTAPATSKSTGNQYGTASAVSSPTRANDIRALADFGTSPECQEELARVWESYAKSKAEIAEQAS